MVEEPAASGAEGIKRQALSIFYGVGGVVLALLVAWLLARIWPVALLVLISLMLVAALTPIVDRIRDRTNRKVAVALVVTFLLLGILTLVAVTLPPVATQLSTLGGDFDRLFKQLQAQLAQSSPEMAKILGQTKVAAMPTASAPHAVKEVVLSAFTVVTGFVTVLMLTSYLIVEGPSVATAMVSVFPREKRLRVRQMFSEIGEQVGSYIRGQLITSFLAGLSTYLVLVVLGIPNALALAWLMAILDAIPIVGPILGMVPAVVSAYGASSEKAVYVLTALVVYHQIESYVIVPRVYGRAMKLSPLAVLLSILIGTALLGMTGAFLALPVAAAMPILLRYYHESRQEVEPELPD